MIVAVLLIAVGVALCFGLVVLVGPPYVPSLAKQIDTALDLLDLQPGQRLLELGSGDGRVLLAAAKRGLVVMGYELNPILVLISRWRTRHYRHQVRVKWGSYWQQWPPAEGIFSFLLPRYMLRLDTRIRAWRKPGTSVRLASFAFPIPHQKPHQVRANVYLYQYD